MTSATATSSDRATATQVYRVYIKASQQAIWEAITSPEWVRRYGYGGLLTPGFEQGRPFAIKADEQMQAAGMPDTVVDGEVLESDEPSKLVLSWRAAWGDEPATRLTYEIKPWGEVCSLTVTHELDGAPQLAAMVGGAIEASGAGGGWAQVLSDLKTLLETGTSLYGH